MCICWRQCLLTQPTAGIGSTTYTPAHNVNLVIPDLLYRNGRLRSQTHSHPRAFDIFHTNPPSTIFYRSNIDINHRKKQSPHASIIVYSKPQFAISYHAKLRQPSSLGRPHRPQTSGTTHDDRAIHRRTAILETSQRKRTNSKNNGGCLDLGNGQGQHERYARLPSRVPVSLDNCVSTR